MFERKEKEMIHVAKGTVNNDDGRKERHVSLENLDSVAIQSTMQVLENHRQATRQVEQELARVQSLLAKRRKEGAQIEKILEDTWVEVKKRNDIPERVRLQDLTWVANGKFKYELLPGEGEEEVDEDGTEQHGC